MLTRIKQEENTTYIIEFLLKMLKMEKDVQRFVTNNGPSQWGENLCGNPDTSGNPDTFNRCPLQV